MEKYKKTIKLIEAIVISSIIIGIISSIFLKALKLVTKLRMENQILILLIPVVGVLTAFAYTKYGKNSYRGNNLVIDSFHGKDRVPLRMALLTFIFTILTHLSGGSAGREGTAVQIGGALTNKISNIFKLEKKEKKYLIMSGVSAAFGSVFGTPLAGAFFGMEVFSLGKLKIKGIIYCFLSSYLANYVTEFLGISHEIYIIKEIPKSFKFIIILIISSILFGLTARLFAVGIKRIKAFYAKNIKNYLLRAFIGSIIIIIIIVIFNLKDFQGLSTEMIEKGFLGETTVLDSLKKLFFTVMTLGAGFQGGEVTPLFDIGASLGGALGVITKIEPSILAALGMICVFGSAANTPITTIFLGIDLFGIRALPYYIIASIISYYITGHNGIYGAQVIEIPKRKNFKKYIGKTIEKL